MAGIVFLGSMAAFGAMSLLWALLGWLLPVGRGAALVCVGVPDEGVLCRVKWLRSLGLLRLPLLVVTEADAPGQMWDGIEYCSGEDLLSRLEQERMDGYGTGNGDPSGNRGCGGLSEL